MICYNACMEIRAGGSIFALEILGYQYPDAVGEPYDANWLQVRVDASGPQGAWSVTDPCLLVSEAVRLAEWLAAVGSGAEASPALSFLEPGLLFRQVLREGDERFLRVHFGSLVQPNWGPQASTRGENPDLWLDFPLAEIDLPATAGSLKERLKKFPQRYER